MWAQSPAEIGKIIATARRQRRLTQAAVARSLGVTQYWISEIERGKDSAHIGKVLRVLSFLGVRLQVGEAPWKGGADSAAETATGPSLGDILTAHSVPARAAARAVRPGRSQRRRTP